MSQRVLTEIWASATEASIRSAASAANALGGGIVHIPGGNITLTSPLTVYSGVYYKGVAPALQFTSDVPDSTFSWLSGTKLSGDGTFRAFEANNTNQGSPASPFTTNAISNFGIENMALDNFTDAIRIGAVNNIGLQFSKLRNLFITNCSGWGIFLANFMHCDIQRIWTKLCQNGQYYAASVASATLMPGNSYMHTLFNIIPSDGRDNRLCRGIVFDANTSTSILNELRLARIQNNSFSRTKLSVAATFTNGSTSIGVPDGTKFAVGMPVAFTAAANGFSASQIYCVLSVAGNVITLGNSRTSAAISSTGTTGLTLESWGFPCVEIVSAGASAHVQNLSANGVDIEGASSAGLYVENAATIDIEVSEVPGSKHADICLRSTTYSRFRSCGQAVTDIDGTSSTATEFVGTRSTQIQRSGRGLYYDNVNSLPTLSIRGNSTVVGGDIHMRSGSSLAYFNTAMGQHQAQRDSTVTLGANQYGDVIFNGATGQTFTLPTITTDATLSTTNIGVEFTIFNVSANSLTVATDGTQLFNNVAAKTSLTVATQTWLEVKACKTAGGTLFWTARAGSLS
ncbi:hypothetical protein IVB12_16145 [Bradyrhizobium sp. 179]|uniref:hypothetical protein n=1 Tax=Bradyrhizobium sp. 179 TaxID=2782648 RepID=UPI001FF73BFA|nr:hypothetical protein [Bradyrhizobium sp. 179]MCK1543449.1 hypothetical protein [Bradyrhizobium sp. 179]